MLSGEMIIFWLVPVALLIVFIISLLAHARQPQRRKLILLEPLGTLITGWRPVRFIGDQPRLEQALAQLSASQPDDGAPLDQIRLLDRHAASITPTLLERHHLGAWTEQRVLGEGSRSLSLHFGEAATVLATSRYRSDGRSLLTESDQAEWLLTAQRAGEHGYLPLAVAERYFHSRVIEPNKHTWLGLILLEPVIDEGLLGRLQAVSPNRLKFMSVLPVELLTFLHGKLRGQSQLAGLPTRPVSDPVSRESFWQASAVLGSMTFAERYALVRFFESRRDCRVVSALSSDDALPTKVTQSF